MNIVNFLGGGSIMRKIFGICVFHVLAFAVAAAPSTALKFSQYGEIEAAGAIGTITVANEKWHSIFSRKFQNGKIASPGNGRKIFSANFFFSGSEGAVRETFSQKNDGSFLLDAKLAFAPALKANRISLNFTLDAFNYGLLIDGKEILLPEKSGKIYEGNPEELILRGIGTEELILRPRGGRVLVEDNRARNGEQLTLSLFFKVPPGPCSQAELSLEGKVRKIKFLPVSIAKAVNRSISDTAERPGWTLQGSNNDLSTFQGKSGIYGGVPFQPERNMAIAVGGPKRSGAVREQTLELAAAVRGMNAVELLHTSAWTTPAELGEMEILFAGGRKQLIRLKGQRDLGDWTDGSSYSNAVPVWTKENRHLYLSGFSLRYPDPVRITFRAVNRDVFWFVCGVTFSGQKVLSPRISSTLRIAAPGREWNVLHFRNRTIPGSALDFSGMLDAPAGKYGRALPKKDGSFRFSNGKELRIFGINICQSACFPTSRQQADLLADRIARTGYNAVRLMRPSNSLQMDPEGKVAFHPAKIKAFDYLIAALRKRGIYYTFDMFIDANDKDNDLLNALVCGSHETRATWRRMAKMILRHRNPYTGLMYAEDPAMLFCNLLNEDNITARWDYSKETRTLYTGLFKAWCKKRETSAERVDVSNPVFLEFLLGLQEDFHRDGKKYLREVIKTDLPVTSLNFRTETYLIPMRENFDVVDTHMYHAHPMFKGRAWHSERMFSMQSAISIMAKDLPGYIIHNRMYGKPFFVTEYDFGKPNPSVAEGGALIGAYAGLQGWTGIFHFCLSHSVRRVETQTPALDAFETVGNPVKQLGDRITAALFLRGDVQQAQNAWAFTFPRDGVPNGEQVWISSKFKYLGLVSRIGTAVTENGLPEGVRRIPVSMDYASAGPDAEAWRNAIEKKRAVSSTGEIIMDAAKGTFSVVTPRTESLTLEGGMLSGNVLRVKHGTGRQNVSLISLDGKPLSVSRRMLLLHLTDLTNSNSKVLISGNHAVPRELGTLPLLVRKATAEVEIVGDLPFTVTALSADGAPLGLVKTSRDKKSSRFSIDIGMFPEGVIAYELTR